MRSLILYSLVVVMCSLWPNASQAQLTTIQPLDFGEFMSRNNDAQYTLTVNAAGSYSFDATGFIEISPPQPGIYDIGGFAPNAAISSLTVAQDTPLGGVGLVFQMISFDEIHPPTTDGAGVARIQIGATLQTSGSGMPYGDALYNGSVDVTINF